MPNCTQVAFDFPALKRRRVEANFQGGEITSDSGVTLLRQADRWLGLTEAIAGVLAGERRQTIRVLRGPDNIRETKKFACVFGTLGKPISRNEPDGS